MVPVDDNCDGTTGYADSDDSPACEDCDDTDAGRSPLLPEVCDDADVDEDCSGTADDADPSATGKTSWSLDADTEGYGTTTLVSRCDATATLTTGDCDDTNASINPGAAEIGGDGIEENCDGRGN